MLGSLFCSCVPSWPHRLGLSLFGNLGSSWEGAEQGTGEGESLCAELVEHKGCPDVSCKGKVERSSLPHRRVPERGALS